MFRCAGCDIGLKECILKPGMKVGPAEVGLLASAGNMSINCFKKPLIGILSTGNEVSQQIYSLTNLHFCIVLSVCIIET